MKEKTFKLLRWSEKYTKTDMIYFAKNGFWLLFAQIIASISAFFVTVIFTNILPKETFGQYRFFLSVLPILGIFSLPGFAGEITRSVSRGIKINLNRIANVKMKSSFLGSFISLILSTYYFTQGNIVLASIFLMITFSLPFMETFFIYSFYYKGKKNFRKSAFYELISKICQSIFLILTVFLTQNILFIVLVFISITIVTRLFFYKKTLKDIDNNFDDVGTDDSIKLGKRFSFIGALSILSNHVDKLLVWKFLGAEALAIYVVAFVIPLTIVNLLNFIPQIALPKFANRNWFDKKERSIFYLKIIKAIIPLSLIALLYVILAETIFNIIFPDYQLTLLLIIFPGIVLIFKLINVMFTQIFVSSKKVWSVILFSSTGLLSQILFFFYFTNVFEDPVAGAVFSFLLHHVLVFLLQSSLFKFWGTIENKKV